MKISDFLTISKNIALVKFFNRKIPITVSWALTYRCNAKCGYCGIWKESEEHKKELTTEQIFLIFDQLKNLGMKYVSLTGGEPLLRNDIGKIVKYASDQGVFISLSSNAILFQDKLKEISKINKVNFSLDGPEEIHDRLRGEGSYKKVIEATEIAKKNKIKVVLNATINKDNVTFIDEIYKTAQRLNVNVYFQPVTINILGQKDKNLLVADKNSYNMAIEKLIKEKKAHNKNILNSISGLEHLSKWPNPTKIACAGGKCHFRIDPNGFLSGCARLYLNKSTNSHSIDLLTVGVKEAIKTLPYESCNFCWCAPLVDFNLSYSLDVTSIKTIIEKILYK